MPRSEARVPLQVIMVAPPFLECSSPSWLPILLEIPLCLPLLNKNTTSHFNVKVFEGPNPRCNFQNVFLSLESLLAIVLLSKSSWIKEEEMVGAATKIFAASYTVHLPVPFILVLSRALSTIFELECTSSNTTSIVNFSF